MDAATSTVAALFLLAVFVVSLSPVVAVVYALRELRAIRRAIEALSPGSQPRETVQYRGPHRL
jgi:hypothetical protein